MDTYRGDYSDQRRLADARVLPRESYHDTHGLHVIFTPRRQIFASIDCIYCLSTKRAKRHLSALITSKRRDVLKDKCSEMFVIHPTPHVLQEVLQLCERLLHVFINDGLVEDLVPALGQSVHFLEVLFGARESSVQRFLAFGSARAKILLLPLE